MALLGLPASFLNERLFLTVPRALTTFLRLRHKDDWKPRPPRWQRDSYFVGEEKPDNYAWAKPILQSKGQLAIPQVPSEPHKLHVVWRLKKLEGQTKQNKEIMKVLGLDGPRHVPAVHKNTPSVNEMLSRVKHLVRIAPLRLPDGLPPAGDRVDLSAMVLRSDGQLVLSSEARAAAALVAAAAAAASPSVSSAAGATVAALPAQGADDGAAVPASAKSVWHLKGETVKRYLRKKILDQNVAAENFKPVYTYRHNQDGKEWVYTSVPVGN